MLITSLVMPIFILILLLLLCHPIKTLRTMIKTFVLIMSVVVGFFALGLIFASVFDNIIGVFGF